MIRIIDYKSIDPSEILDRKENVFNVADTVSEIIRTVREKGDEALFGYCERFDRVKLSSLEVRPTRISGSAAVLRVLSSVLATKERPAVLESAVPKLARSFLSTDTSP